MEQIAKEYGISKATAEQFLQYGINRAKYGRANASINKVQLNSLAKFGFVTKGGCGTVGEVTEKGIELFQKLHAA